MAVDITTIISRVEKLMALGTSSNEHEAALAVAKAHELLAKYDLTMGDVQSLRSDERTDIREGDSLDVSTHGKPEQWRSNLATAVARYFNCWPIRSVRRGGRRYIVTQRFLGFGHDVEAAEYALSFLFGEIDRLAKEYAKLSWDAIGRMAREYGVSYHHAESLWVSEGNHHPLRSAKSFREGAVVGVAAAFADSMRAAKSDLRGTELVQQKGDAIRDWWYRKEYGMSYEEFTASRAQATPTVAPKETDAERRRREAKEARQRERSEAKWHREWVRQQQATDHDAYSMGIDAGRRINIRPGVGRPGKTDGEIA